MVKSFLRWIFVVFQMFCAGGLGVWSIRRWIIQYRTVLKLANLSRQVSDVPCSGKVEFHQLEHAMKCDKSWTNFGLIDEIAGGEDFWHEAKTKEIQGATGLSHPRSTFSYFYFWLIASGGPLPSTFSIIVATKTKIQTFFFLQCLDENNPRVSRSSTLISMMMTAPNKNPIWGRWLMRSAFEKIPK